MKMCIFTGDSYKEEININAEQRFINAIREVLIEHHGEYFLRLSEENQNELVAEAILIYRGNEKTIIQTKRHSYWDVSFTLFQSS